MNLFVAERKDIFSTEVHLKNFLALAQIYTDLKCTVSVGKNCHSVLYLVTTFICMVSLLTSTVVPLYIKATLFAKQLWPH